MKGKAREAAAVDRRAVSYALREAIEADGRTAYAIGQAAEVDAGMIQRFANGERGLSLLTVDRLARALDLRLVVASRGRGRPAKPARPSPTVPDGADAIGQVAEVPEACQADQVPAEVAPDLCQVADSEPLPPEADAPPAAEAEVRSGPEVEPAAQPEAGPVKSFFLGPFAIGNQTDEPIGAE